MGAIVQLMPAAQKKITKIPHDQVRHELGLIFPLAESVTAYDVLRGFQSNQRKKLVLAVETESRPAGPSCPAFEIHIVKLGERDEVAPDVVGWQQCARDRRMSQRMLVHVRMHQLPGASDRAAVIYQHAAQWYGLLTPDEEEVATLAWAADKAVFTDEIEIASVERMIRQVFRELGRSFYRSANEDQAAACEFYRAKLKLDEDQPTVHQWKQDDELWTMRRDADWLLCGSLSPASSAFPDYLDPYDYIVWALDHRDIPPTLVGPSHGDLHASNVIVGVAGTEIEYPLLVDYGDMTLVNVAAWDFVKLETELKVRLMAKLFKNAAVRETVWSRVKSDHFRKLAERWSRQSPSHLDPVVDRTQQIVFAFEFERRLAEQTGLIFRSPRQGDSHLADPHSPLDRAISILQTVRSQAAEQLGRLAERSQSWQEELDFALAAYGLNTVKFSDDAYPVYQRLFALVSAGAAVARMRSARTLLAESLEQRRQQERDALPIYHVPLRQAYRHWQANDQLEEAERVLATVADSFDYAVPLQREYALLQSKRQQPDRALARLEKIAAGRARYGSCHVPGESDIAALCESFLETEVLSRIGRIYKDKADACWQRLDIPFEQMQNQTPAQFYRSAYRVYRAAFELSLNFYPGGNAAVTGILGGARREAEEIASAVGRECATLDLGSLSAADRYWVMATEGDMALILNRGHDAAEFYRAAMDELPQGNDGMVQTSYAQLCRLYMALGDELLRPVLEIFRQTPKFKLSKGPLGDCGGLLSK
jgi:Tetratricopeptide Repeats-Sensor